MRVIAFDPGFVNTGYAVIDMTNGFKIVKTGMLENTIQKFESMRHSVISFESEVTDLINATQPSLIVIERFIGRGFTPKGRNPESVSFMVALLAGLAVRSAMSVMLISAAQWKNAWNKYKIRHKLDSQYKVCAAPPHMLDAVLQAMYGYYKAKKQVPYEDVDERRARIIRNAVVKACDPKLLVVRRCKQLPLLTP